MKFLTITLWGLFLLGSCQKKEGGLVAQSPAKSNQQRVVTAAKEDSMELEDGLYAQLETANKTFIIELFYKKTPLTVSNFVGLTEGVLAKNERAGQPFYDGLLFHRVIAGFVIQGGDPAGNGTGGPGYQFPDEIVPELKHQGKGILSMANAGPGTNGSQFFITLGSQPHLDGLHSVFGRIVKGLDLLDQVKQGDVIEKVKILRIGEQAEQFQVTEESFQALLEKAREKEVQRANALWQTSYDYVTTTWDVQNLTEDASGIFYAVLQAGQGEKPPSRESEVTAHYRLIVVDRAGSANTVDESYKRGEPLTQPLSRLIPGWAIMLTQMQRGEKRVMLIPPDLGYGSRGAPPAIPPNSPLIFEVELLNFSS